MERVVLRAELPRRKAQAAGELELDVEQPAGRAQVELEFARCLRLAPDRPVIQ